MGRTEADRKIASEPWSSWREASKETNEDHSFGVQRRGVSEKDLTEPTLLEITGFPTPMISLVKEAKSLLTRFGGARVQVLFDSSARRLASRPWFLPVVEPDTHWLSQLIWSFHRRLSCCSPASLETNQGEPPELALLRPVGLMARPGRRRAE